MCGIVGVMSQNAVWRERVAAAVDSLAHRGPDGNGIFEHENVSLGHARLAIIDPEHGAQPMTLDGLTVVFNGMIFNYRQLRSELEQAGERFRSECDTEILLHGYRVWGIEGLLRRLNGMFAFALYEHRLQILILARDRLGEKPLYYSRDDQGFIFASEIKAIKAVRGCLTPNIPDDWFVLESTLSSTTLYKEVRAVLPASYMIIANCRIETYEAYWELPKAPFDHISFDEAREKLRELIYDAVKLRMQSDVPLSVFLSGGLDSALIACIARPERVFSAGYPNVSGKFCELDYARKVASHIQADLVEVTPFKNDVETLPNWMAHILYYLDQPISTSSTITAFHLAQRARADGYKVILNGQGSDEVFGGYARYVLMKHESDLKKLPFYQQYTPMARRLWGKECFYPVEKRYLTLNQRVEPKTGVALNYYRCILHDYQQLDLVGQLGALDIHTSLQDLIAMDDRACASVGIESRSPFLDYRIVEFGLRLPDCYKIDGVTTKKILREIARGIVPDEIIDRQDKMGMVSPIGMWLKNNLKTWSLSQRKLVESYIGALPAAENGDYDRRLHAQVMMGLFLKNALCFAKA